MDPIQRREEGAIYMMVYHTYIYLSIYIIAARPHHGSRLRPFYCCVCVMSLNIYNSNHILLYYRGKKEKKKNLEPAHK